MSALLTFGVGVLVRRTAGPAALALAGALLFAPPDAARALELRIDEDTRIAAGETIAETLIASGDLVEIDGKIDGDLIAATKRLVVRGVVTGSIYAFARDIEIVGTVKGGIVAIGERVRVDGAVAGNAYAACERFTIAPHGRVGGDVALFADEAEINGAAGRDVVFAGDRIEVRAAIGRNFEAPRADQVVLGEGARIAGDVDASLPRGTEIEMAPGARVAGEIRTTPRGPLHARYLAHYTELHFYLFLAIELVAGLAFGLLLYRFAPQLFSSRVATAGAFFRTTGIGFLFLLAAPIAILLVGLTIIGLPIALLGLFSYVVAVYCSDIMVGALIGNALMGQRDPSLGAFARAFVPGFAIVIVAHGIPFLGPAVAIVMLLFGSGLVFERGRQLRLSSAPV